jgi:SAM-dependent methyltransferase
VTSEDWQPDGVDLQRPNVARVYDYYLGGSHNFAADREMARRAIALWPDLPKIIRANRAFLQRAVAFLAKSGVRQFVDLGSGMPTAGSVHEVARAYDPGARVVYVDIDPVAVEHARLILRNEPGTAVIRADLREPRSVLGDPLLLDVCDLSQPVAVLMVAVLHFVPDSDDPAGIIAAYHDALAPGSYLAISHASDDAQDPEQAAEHRALYARTGATMTMRSAGEITRMLGAWRLVEPGLVPMPLWRPNADDVVPEDADRMPGYAGVARKLTTTPADRLPA